jgi:hypothetical protein
MSVALTHATDSLFGCSRESQAANQMPGCSNGHIARALMCIPDPGHEEFLLVGVFVNCLDKVCFLGAR